MQAMTARERPNRSIRVCREDIISLNAAAKRAHDPLRRSRLNAQTILHGAWLRELEERFVSEGGMVDIDTSLAARVLAQLRFFGIWGGKQARGADAAWQ
jgi:hypothetical protein